MFLDTNVTDLLKKNGVTELIFEKLRYFRLFSVTIIRYSCYGNAAFIRILLVCDTSYYVLQL
jgi:hypothetical protein